VFIRGEKKTSLLFATNAHEFVHEKISRILNHESMNLTKNTKNLSWPSHLSCCFVVEFRVHSWRKI